MHLPIKSIPMVCHTYIYLFALWHLSHVLQNSFTRVIYHSTPIKPLRYFGKPLISSKVTTTKFSAMTSFKSVLFVLLSHNLQHYQLAQSNFRSPESLHFLYRDKKDLLPSGQNSLLSSEDSLFRSYYKEEDRFGYSRMLAVRRIRSDPCHLEKHVRMTEHARDSISWRQNFLRIYSRYVNCERHA